MTAFGLLLATVALSSAAVPDSSPRALSLSEAVALAERNAPQVIQALGQQRTAAAGVRSAYGAFLPSVSISSGATRQVPSRGGGTRVENGQIITLPDQPWSYNAGVSATLQLFAGGKRIFDLQQARARASAASVNERSQRFAAVLAVKQQFFDVLAARESEAAARAQVEQAEHQLEMSIARLASQSVTRSDSLRAVIQVRAARIAVMEARNSLGAANAALGRVVGAPYPVTASDADTLAEPPLMQDDATLRALAEAGPAVAQAQADLDAARASRRAAWTSYLPGVSARYSRSGNGVGSDLVPPGDAFSYSGSLGLSLSLPVFNQFQREEQLTQAQVAEENAAVALRDARLAARANIIDALGTLHLAEERIASGSASLAAAEEDLRMQRQRYGLGASTLLDVLSSQTTLDQARRDLIRARYDARIARAQIEALVGQAL